MRGRPSGLAGFTVPAARLGFWSVVVSQTIALSTSTAPAGANKGAGKWVVAMTVMFGAFMAVMDISVVNVALPHMMGTFGQDLSAITWVATGYSIAEIIMVNDGGLVEHPFRGASGCTCSRLRCSQ